MHHPLLTDRAEIYVALGGLRLEAGRRQTALGLSIEVRRQRSFTQRCEVVLEMHRIDGAHDRRVHVWMRKGEPQYEFDWGHPLQQIVEAGLLPAVPLRPGALLWRGGSLCSTTADDDAGARCGCRSDRSLVLALDRRIGDLEDVKDTHRDVILQMRKRAGHADEAHLAGAFEIKQRLDGAIFGKCLLRRRAVELHDVEMVRLHADQALFDPG